MRRSPTLTGSDVSYRETEVIANVRSGLRHQLKPDEVFVHEPRRVQYRCVYSASSLADERISDRRCKFRK
jgi:hypothetical protein